MIIADYYSTVTGELDKAVQTYQEEIEIYPQESTAYIDLSAAVALEGQYERAAEILRQAMQSSRIAPDAVTEYTLLPQSDMALQRFDEAREFIRERQARKLDNYQLHLVLYGLAFLGVDSAGLAEQQQWFAGDPNYEHFGLALASDTEAYGGHLGKARELTERAGASAVRADSKENGAVWQENGAVREAAFGNATAAKEAAAD